MATQTDLLARAKTACEKLKAAFPSRVVAEGEPGYEAEIDRSWYVLDYSTIMAYWLSTNYLVCLNNSVGTALL